MPQIYFNPLYWCPKLILSVSPPFSDLDKHYPAFLSLFYSLYLLAYPFCLLSLDSTLSLLWLFADVCLCALYLTLSLWSAVIVTECSVLHSCSHWTVTPVTLNFIFYAAMTFLSIISFSFLFPKTHGLGDFSLYSRYLLYCVFYYILWFYVIFTSFIFSTNYYKIQNRMKY